ncbi:MAG TPA: hypothetical protein VGA07_10305 [Anaerolineales bacterium]
MSLPSRLWVSVRAKPGRLLLALAVLLAGIDTALAATALQSLSSAKRLGTDVLTLQDSLEQLRRVEQEGLQGLEAQALAEEAQLAELRAGFPSLGEPFDLFRRGFTLASLNQVELESIERGSSSVLETPIGLLTTTSYSLRAASELPGCLGFLSDLELSGLTTLSVDHLSLAPPDLRCDFDVILASAAPAPEPPEE